MKMLMKILLASGSPRRRELLAGVGWSCSVVVPAVDEQLVPSESPEQAAGRLATLKRDRVLTGACIDENTLTVAADTLIDLDGEVLGKPLDSDDACRMLTRLSGRSHQVHTGLALAFQDQTVTAVSTTNVLFRKLDPSEIVEYVNSESVLECAGSYRIQNRGAFLVEAVQGSYSGVVGLPLDLLYLECLRLGFPLLSGATV